MSRIEERRGKGEVRGRRDRGRIESGRVKGRGRGRGKGRGREGRVIRKQESKGDERTGGGREGGRAGGLRESREDRGGIPGG